MPETNENKTFDFLTAVKYLDEGKKVRPVYEPSHIFYVLRPHPYSSQPVLYTSEGYEVCFRTNCFALDWELYNG